MEALSETAEAFVSLVLQVLPWFALGTLTASLMEPFVPARLAARALSGRTGFGKRGKPLPLPSVWRLRTPDLRRSRTEARRRSRSRSRARR
jgi:hypothetical protein